MPDLKPIKRLLRNPRGHELEIGFALNSLAEADLESLGHASLTEFIKSDLLAGVEKPDYSTVMCRVGAASIPDGPSN